MKKRTGKRPVDNTPKVDNVLRVSCPDCKTEWFTNRPNRHPAPYVITCPGCGNCLTLRFRKLTEGEIIRLAKGG